MSDRADVCVLLPTLDEAETIGDVIDGFRAEGFERILVVDGDSSDGTREIAEDHGARVIVQSGRGKGQAVREGVEAIDAPYVLMADGDGTYRPEDADAMLEPLFEGRAQHVIGNRFADMEPGAMTRLNAVGNRLINRLFAAIHGRALGGSETNLNPLTDGGRIVLTVYALAKTNNPIFYFGSVASLGTVAGVLVGAFVGYRYFVAGVSHEVLALLSAFLILLSVQLLMFGVLSDILVSVNREQTRRLEEISDRLRELEE